MWTSISDLNQFAQVGLRSSFYLRSGNPLTVFTHEVFNYFRGFLLHYEGWMSQIYYSCKHMGLGLRDILWEIPYYELLWLIDKFTEELEEKAKHDQEEKERMDSEMARMQSSMNRQQKMSTPTVQQPNFKIPNMPKF